LIGEEFQGVHEMLANSIQRTDMDLRKTLYGNIVLAGGSTLFPGFGDRLLNEVKHLAPADTKIKISAPPGNEYFCKVTNIYRSQILHLDGRIHFSFSYNVQEYVDKF
jgi:hypothetical protein